MLYHPFFCHLQFYSPRPHFSHSPEWHLPFHLMSSLQSFNLSINTTRVHRSPGTALSQHYTPAATGNPNLPPHPQPPNHARHCTSTQDLASTPVPATQHLIEHRPLPKCLGIVVSKIRGTSPTKSTINLILGTSRRRR